MFVSGFYFHCCSFFVFMIFLDAENHKLLSDRRDQYKLAAMRSKQSGYGEMAMKYLKTAKVFDEHISCSAYMWYSGLSRLLCTK